MIQKKVTKNKLGLNAALNEAGYHSTAMMSATMEVQNGYGDRKHIKHVDGEFYISDCSKVISLNLDYNDEKEHKNTLHKLNTLIETFTILRDWIAQTDPSFLNWNDKTKNK